MICGAMNYKAVPEEKCGQNASTSFVPFQTNDVISDYEKVSFSLIGRLKFMRHTIIIVTFKEHMRKKVFPGIQFYSIKFFR